MNLNTEQKNYLKNTFGEVLFNEPLKNHNSYQIGGEADILCELHEIKLLPLLINFCKSNNLPFFILGGGYNVLFPDTGFKGMIIKMKIEKLIVDGNQVEAQAGVKIGQLLRIMGENNLTGIEFDIGLPGTVGGAIRGNAGRFGSFLSDYLIWVEYFDALENAFFVLNKDTIDFGYRNSDFKQFPQRVITRALFEFPKASAEEIITKKKNAIEKSKSYPDSPNCGSFFKNPSPNKPAGMLIDQCGLKGYRIGNAQISDQHGNFLLNLGGATSKDIINLANLIKMKVKEKFGIDLEEEVVIVDKGDFSPLRQ